VRVGQNPTSSLGLVPQPKEDVGFRASTQPTNQGIASETRFREPYLPDSG